MMWAQIDFLAIFTIDVAALFPAVDVVQYLVDTPTPLEATRRLSAFASPLSEARFLPAAGGGAGSLRASPAFFARVRSPAAAASMSPPAPDRPPSLGAALSPPQVAPRFVPSAESILLPPRREAATAASADAEVAEAAIASPTRLEVRSAEWARRLAAREDGDS